MLVPGWYIGRAPHFHIKVYPRGRIAQNGTFVTQSAAVHTGQFFFDLGFYAKVAARAPYNTNAVPYANMTTNQEVRLDSWSVVRADACCRICGTLTRLRRTTMLILR